MKVINEASQTKPAEQSMAVVLAEEDTTDSWPHSRGYRRRRYLAGSHISVDSCRITRRECRRMLAFSQV